MSSGGDRRGVVHGGHTTESAGERAVVLMFSCSVRRMTFLSAGQSARDCWNPPINGKVAGQIIGDRRLTNHKNSVAKKPQRFSSTALRNMMPGEVRGRNGHLVEFGRSVSTTLVDGDSFLQGTEGNYLETEVGQRMQNVMYLLVVWCCRSYYWCYVGADTVGA